MQNLVNYAKSYAEHGFSVIPIGNDKRPLIKFANKPALTVDEIEAIWKRYPFAKIALKTEQFFVVDVDKHHSEADGLESIKDLNHDEWFKDTLTEITAHGGYHFYFRKPKNEEITQNIGWLPGVDIKAHVNNYVVCAPSAGYKWLNHKPMKDAPEELIKAINKNKKQENLSLDQIDNIRFSGKSQTAILFEQIVDGLGETGGRNNALAAFMGGLLYRNVDPEKAVKLAILANDATEDKLSSDELIRTVQSMIDKDIRRREGG